METSRARAHPIRKAAATARSAIGQTFKTKRGSQAITRKRNATGSSQKSKPATNCNGEETEDVQVDKENDATQEMLISPSFRSTNASNDASDEGMAASTQFTPLSSITSVSSQSTTYHRQSSGRDERSSSEVTFIINIPLVGSPTRNH